MRHLLVMLVLLAGCSGGERFDPRKWREADLATRERAKMVGGLLKAHRLVGLDRAAVVDLLGEPTATDKWADSEMIYVLGPEDGIVPIDHDWLLIEMNPQGRVSDYRVVSD